jgi:hypothetical protein
VPYLKSELGEIIGYTWHLAIGAAAGVRPEFRCCLLLMPDLRLVLPWGHGRPTDFRFDFRFGAGAVTDFRSVLQWKLELFSRHQHPCYLMAEIGGQPPASCPFPPPQLVLYG